MRGLQATWRCEREGNDVHRLRSDTTYLRSSKEQEGAAVRCMQTTWRCECQEPDVYILGLQD